MNKTKLNFQKINNLNKTKNYGRKLKIAQIAPLWFPIPPKKYGGSERIISNLTEELVRRGHKVTLFASGDSKTKAKLVPLLPKGAIYSGANWHDYWWNLWNHSVVIEKASQFDIIHCHWPIMGVYFQRFSKTPILHTLHNIPSQGHLRWKIFEYYKNDLNLAFISKSEAEKKNTPLKFKNSWVVYNATDLKKFKFRQNPKDYFVWVGRVCRAKGIENAIKIAQKTNIKLILAGQIQSSAEKYFNDKVKPFLSSKIKFVGELSRKELSELYGNAKALLYPIEWEEPFGLVMTEAMACGTPVIVFDRGSAKEVVKNGETGFVVKNINEAVKAIKKIGGIDRKKCRQRVEENFSVEKMTDNYEKVYYEMLKRKSKQLKPANKKSSV